MIAADTAMACGESLYRVGRGVLYREYTAPLPGRILIVAGTDGERAMAEQIAAAGHDVHVVESPIKIAEELDRADHEFDLVLAYFSQQDEVESQTTAKSIGFLPVVKGDAEASAAKLRYPLFVADDASVKRFLRVIHSSLRQRL